MKNRKLKGILKSTTGLMAAVILSMGTLTGCGSGDNSAKDGVTSEDITAENIVDESNSADGSSLDESASQSGDRSDSQNSSQSGDQSDSQNANQSGDQSDSQNSNQSGDINNVQLPDTYPVYVLNETTAKLIGRNYISDDELWCALSGSGAEFIYYGAKLDLTFLADGAKSSEGSRARVAVYIDGERVLDEMLDKEKETFTVYEGEAKEVTVQIVKLSEAASSTLGIGAVIVADGEWIIPTEAKEHRIEFIGDSITCGYGVDDEVKEHHFSTATEDVTRAWAYKTAQLLDADYSIFSYSGWGVISGYTGNSAQKSDSQLVPAVYEQLAFSYQQMDGSVNPQDIKWDFAKYQPDAVVINLGTNDASYCDNSDKKQEYVQGYVEFLKKVRKNNPNAYIFCALGTMGDSMLTSIKTAVQLYTEETNDVNVSVIALPVQNSADGYAADWHPTEKTHEKAAKVAANEIKKVMGW